MDIDKLFDYLRKAAQGIMGLVALGMFVSFRVAGDDVPPNMMILIGSMLGLATFATIRGKNLPDDDPTRPVGKGFNSKVGDAPDDDLHGPPERSRPERRDGPSRSERVRDLREQGGFPFGRSWRLHWRVRHARPVAHV